MNKTGFQKGNTHWQHPKAVEALKKNHEKPWNKGIKTGIVPKTAIKKGEHLSPDTEFKKGEHLGDQNVMWSGDRPAYRPLHHWVERHLGKPMQCENCGTKDAGKRYDWANKSHQYKRDLTDWMRLCRKCHKNYDMEHIKSEALWLLSIS